MQILRGRRHLIQELVFSHCGRWLAAGGSGGGLHVWDTADPTAKPRQPNPDQRAANALAFRTDGRLFFPDQGSRCFLYDPGADAVTRLGTSRVISIVPSADGELPTGGVYQIGLYFGRRDAAGNAGRRADRCLAVRFTEAP